MDEFEDKYYAAGNQAKAELKRGNVEFNANKGKGMAAKDEGFKFIGIEREKEYFDI